jgi:hypothetical protein
MLSGIQSNFDSRHIARIVRENKQTGSITTKIKVQSKKIETICDEYNIKHIHYLSIDVEGSEFDVIKSINFNKVFIDIIGFENNYDDVSIPIIDYLKNNNYILIQTKQKMYDIFMINRQSQFFN